MIEEIRIQNDPKNVDEFGLEASFSNVIIKKEAPVLVADNTDYVTLKGGFGDKNVWKISVTIFDRVGISSEKIIFSEGDSSESSDYFSNTKLSQNGNNYVIESSYILPRGTEPAQCKLLIYDTAGNPFTYKLKEFVFLDITLDEIARSLKHLELSFVDTNPANLQLGTQVVGKTKAAVFNPNVYDDVYKILLQYQEPKVVFELAPNSIGYLTGDPKNEDDVVLQSIDGIDSSGMVTVRAHLQFNFSRIIDELIAQSTRVEGSLGQWIKRCEGARAEFIPMPAYLDGSKFDSFKKFVEFFIGSIYDTMDYTPCKVGPNEKIKRIGDFNNPDDIEIGVMDLYRSEWARDIELTMEDLDVIAGMLSDNPEVQFDKIKILRQLMKTYPAVNRVKGTDAALFLILNALGFYGSLNPLYIDNETHSQFARKEQIIDLTKWTLSSHVELTMRRSDGLDPFNAAAFAETIVRLSKKLIPATRVINKVNFENLTNVLNIHLVTTSIMNDLAGYTYSEMTFNGRDVYFNKIWRKNAEVDGNILQIPYNAISHRVRDLDFTITDVSEWRESTLCCYNYLDAALNGAADYDNQIIMTISYKVGLKTFYEEASFELGDVSKSTYGFDHTDIEFADQTVTNKVQSLIAKMKRCQGDLTICVVYNRSRESVRFCKRGTNSYPIGC